MKVKHGLSGIIKPKEEQAEHCEVCKDGDKFVKGFDYPNSEGICNVCLSKYYL